jgi:hypothetical protein
MAQARFGNAWAMVFSGTASRPTGRIMQLSSGARGAAIAARAAKFRETAVAGTLCSEASICDIRMREGQITRRHKAFKVTH